MNKLSIFFLIVYLLLFAVAAPRPATTSSTSTSSHTSSHNSTSTSTSTSSSPISTKAPLPSKHTPHGPEPQESTRTSPLAIPRPGSPPTRSITHDRPLSTGEPFHNHSQQGQKPISIAFEVLGGLVVSALLFSFIRCFYNYRKTPGRDRIAEILQRHQLQRELEELERNPGLLRRYPSLREPAPPYFPRPPSYDHQGSSAAPNSAAPRERPPEPDNRAQYSPVATSSPPSSPPMAEHILLPTPAATLRPHPELPT